MTIISLLPFPSLWIPLQTHLACPLWDPLCCAGLGVLSNLPPSEAHPEAAGCLHSIFLWFPHTAQRPLTCLPVSSCQDLGGQEFGLERTSEIFGSRDPGLLTTRSPLRKLDTRCVE